MLSDDTDVTEDLQISMQRFVCDVYCPKGIQIGNIPELRWHLFCKHMAENDKLPQTLGALKKHILRVHVQARIWGQASIANQFHLDPLVYGYHKDMEIISWSQHPLMFHQH